jgi:hypothetical protein
MRMSAAWLRDHKIRETKTAAHFMGVCWHWPNFIAAMKATWK